MIICFKIMNDTREVITNSHPPFYKYNFRKNMQTITNELKGEKSVSENNLITL